ncbi:BTAD domain-containing putative transcriptional regulator [Streptomyces sp. NPDC005811]|uniref:AfsR/SARP family transcriptional regulator n=1 Tax=Streptomyces sp. NPDC005811 TaxID=3154565 RepID=UPI003409D1AA
METQGADVEVRVLGPVEALRDGAPVALGGVKTRTMLAALLLARGRVVADSRLSFLLWGWDPPATVNAQIYSYVYRLRKLLGPGVELVRRAPGYALGRSGVRTDLAAFERLDTQGARELADGRISEADTRFRAALDLWRGSALADVSPYLAEFERAGLEEARAATLERRITVDLALGRHQQLVPELTGLLTASPVRERLRGQLMTALHRSGRQADALRVYHEGRAVLAEELGVDPGPELTAVFQTVLRGDPAPGGPSPRPRAVPEAGPARPASARPASAGAAPTGAAVPAMLPSVPGDFTGRTDELGSLLSRLVPLPEGGRSGFRPRRLLITGMAGVGKTALALHAAHTRLRHFPDGQLYADLCHPDGSRKDPCRILPPLLRALGEPADVVQRRSDDLDELVRLFRARTTGRRLLIVLDNAVGDLQLDPLLPSCPAPALLITGRRRLAAVPGSHTVSLAPLDEETALAVLVAIAGQRRFTAEPEATRELLRLCAGLPLALRIAGSRLSARPHWPVSRLVRVLADPAQRLRALRFGDLDLAPRLRQSLRQLEPDGPRLLGPLAECGERSFSAGAAGALLGLPRDRAERFLEDLVDNALLETEGLDRAGQPLYRFHAWVLRFAESLTARTVAP